MGCSDNEKKLLQDGVSFINVRICKSMTYNMMSSALCCTSTWQIAVLNNISHPLVTLRGVNFSSPNVVYRRSPICHNHLANLRQNDLTLPFLSFVGQHGWACFSSSIAKVGSHLLFSFIIIYSFLFIQNLCCELKAKFNTISTRH